MPRANFADETAVTQLAQQDTGTGPVPVTLPDGSVYLATGDEADTVTVTIDKNFKNDVEVFGGADSDTLEGSDRADGPHGGDGTTIDHDDDPGTPMRRPDNHPWALTENGLRDEHGRPLRETYR